MVVCPALEAAHAVEYDDIIFSSNFQTCLQSTARLEIHRFILLETTSRSVLLEFPWHAIAHASLEGQRIQLTLQAPSTEQPSTELISLSYPQRHVCSAMWSVLQHRWKRTPVRTLHAAELGRYASPPPAWAPTVGHAPHTSPRPPWNTSLRVRTQAVQDCLERERAADRRQRLEFYATHPRGSVARGGSPRRDPVEPVDLDPPHRQRFSGEGSISSREAFERREQRHYLSSLTRPHERDDDAHRSASAGPYAILQSELTKEAQSGVARSVVPPYHASGTEALPPYPSGGGEHASSHHHTADYSIGTSSSSSGLLDRIHTVIKEEERIRQGALRSIEMDREEEQRELQRLTRRRDEELLLMRQKMEAEDAIDPFLKQTKESLAAHHGRAEQQEDLLRRLQHLCEAGVECITKTGVRAGEGPAAFSKEPTGVQSILKSSSSSFRGNDSRADFAEKSGSDAMGASSASVKLVGSSSSLSAADLHSHHQAAESEAAPSSGTNAGAPQGAVHVQTSTPTDQTEANVAVESEAKAQAAERPAMRTLGEWREVWDAKKGKYYYSNTQTKKTQWSSKGTTFEGKEGKPAAAPSSESAVAGEKAAAVKAHVPQPDTENKEAKAAKPTTEMDELVAKALREKTWLEKVDPKTGKTFYYHPATKKTVWDLKKELTKQAK